MKLRVLQQQIGFCVHLNEVFCESRWFTRYSGLSCIDFCVSLVNVCTVGIIVALTKTECFVQLIASSCTVDTNNSYCICVVVGDCKAMACLSGGDV